METSDIGRIDGVILTRLAKLDARINLCITRLVC